MAKTYGIIGIFDSAPAIYHAAEETRDAGYKNWDTITPFPVHGLNHAMGLKRSKVPIFTFCGGFIGFCTGMFIAWYMGYLNYPLIVGGKPYFSPIFPFPVAYELTILLASFGTLGGMFFLNRLPMHYHPLMNYEKFHRLTDDQFGLVIEAEDPQFDESATRAYLEKLGATDIVLLSD